MNNPIILLEGPDASGKTTLANRIMDKYRNHVYIHCAVTDDIFKLHLDAIRTAEACQESFVVIIDRLYVSERIYGNIFRKGESYNTLDFERNIVDKLADVHKILCIIDKETTMAKHNERLEKEMFNNISEVWDAYNLIGNSDSNYNFQNWIRYNWKENDINLNTFTVSKKS